MTSTPADKAAVERVFGPGLIAGSAEGREAANDRESGDHDRWLRENVPPHHH